MTSKITAARLHRRSPSTLGAKAAVANLVIGKAEDHRNTVMKARSADLDVLLIVFTSHDRDIITKKEEKCNPCCGIL